MKKKKKTLEEVGYDIGHEDFKEDDKCLLFGFLIIAVSCLISAILYVSLKY